MQAFLALEVVLILSILRFSVNIPSAVHVLTKMHKVTQKFQKWTSSVLFCTENNAYRLIYDVNFLDSFLNRLRAQFSVRKIPETQNFCLNLCNPMRMLSRKMRMQIFG